MREILFRGKTEDGKWVYGYLFVLGKGSEYEETYILGDIDHRDSIYDVWKNAKRVIPETVSQWTSMIDRNGKKIFEGDYVVMSQHEGGQSGIVRYSTVNATFKIVNDWGWWAIEKYYDLRVIDKEN